MIENIEQVHEFTQGFTEAVNKRFPELQLKFILHHRGQRNDAIEMARSHLDLHPSGSIAMNILRKTKSTQKSGFHGLAIETQMKWFGFKKIRSSIGVITINVDDYGTSEAILADVYHYGCHAIMAAELLDTPKYRSSAMRGPMVPKRSPLSMAKANLTADIFSVFILCEQEHDVFITSLAAERALDTMLAKANSRPWHYPYPLSYETVREVWIKVLNQKDPEFDPIKTPLKTAKAITDSFEQISFSQWWAFCKPAQEMAWNGSLPEHILTAALLTSQDPLVKTNAMLLQDCLDVALLGETEIEGQYNAFLDEEQKKENHFKKIEDTFEMVLAKGIAQESARPFMEAANAQNVRLMQGGVFGWCASALQAAGKAFETALSGGKDPRQFAEIEFKSIKKNSQYDKLQLLQKEIFDKRKIGENVTIDDVKAIIQESGLHPEVTASLEQTVNDPEFQKELTKGLAPKAVPAAGPSGPAPIKPDVAPQVAPMAMPSAPGLGGGTTQTTTEKPSEKTDKEDDTKKTG